MTERTELMHQSFVTRSTALFYAARKQISHIDSLHVVLKQHCACVHVDIHSLIKNSKELCDTQHNVKDVHLFLIH